MAVTTRRRVGRRLTGLLPRLAIGVLFLAPALVWLIKREQPVIEESTPGRILEMTALPMLDSGAADRFTVRLRDGSVAVFDTEPTAMPFRPGDDIVVIRMTHADGSVGFRVERE